MVLKKLLQKMNKMHASDLYLSSGSPPAVKVDGQLHSVEEAYLSNEDVKKFAYDIMTPAQIKDFEKKLEMNLALSFDDVGRFRVNIFVQRTDVAMVIRRIQTEIPTIESLGLPSIMTDIIMEKRGLVLFVGSTGSGKSTSLAALINHRGNECADYIITIEDPIEFIHPHSKSIINQREVGLDTLSYDEALKNTLRQSPDVIMIGEIRSRETMKHALAFAETGHLCLSTLHANNANQAFERILNFFPGEQKNQVLLDLSFNLRAIISQRLIPMKDGKRVAAIEILLGTPLILSLIRRGEIDSIKEAMERSTECGMQTFDQALAKLYFEDKITLTEALRNADSKNNLRLKISLSDKLPTDEDEKLLLSQAHSLSVETPLFGEHKKWEQDGFSLLDD